jgi:eukaryotic-like serine/threonine-protein kinase
MDPLPSPQPVAPEGSDPHTDPIPRRFGKYTLLRKLAVGGMAELFLAIQKSVAGFEKLIVIKRILPAMNQDRAFIAMLLHEARIAATLSHANIVHVFDVGQVGGTYYIAMEHVHGEDLRSIVRQMRKKAVSEFPLEHALSIILSVCSGLAYAHEKRDLDGSSLHIVHRDISPHNVVVTFSGDVKIVDFGIAQSNALVVETRSGTLKGKVSYMSPEQARGQDIDSRSDIFAVGVMLFELTTGKRLFKTPSDFETLKLICDKDYPLPSQMRPGYPPELEHIVTRALSKDRDARYQTAREMQAALEEFVRRERVPVSNIALTGFMQSLFEEKLATLEQDLVAGKQLADRIDLELGSESPLIDEPNHSPSHSSAAPASRTITDLSMARAKRGGLVAALVAFPLVAAVCSSGFVYWQHKPEVTSATLQAVPLPVSRGSIRVASNPPGATIWVDGEMRSDLTPAVLTELPTGRPIEVKVTKEGYEPYRQSLTLAASEPNRTMDVALSNASVAVDLNVIPAWLPFAVLLDGDVAVLSADAHTLEGVSTGELHTLVVSAPGYVAQTINFTTAPQERKRLEVTLPREARYPRSTSTPPAVLAPPARSPR